MIGFLGSFSLGAIQKEILNTEQQMNRLRQQQCIYADKYRDEEKRRRKIRDAAKEWAMSWPTKHRNHHA